MRNKIKLILICLTISACSTTRVTCDADEDNARIVTTVKETVITPTSTTFTATSGTSILNRDPDLVSVPAQVTFAYPERVNPALYRVVLPVNVRDFPSMSEGKIVGQLKPGERVVGNEIEGQWIRIYENSYTSLKALRRVY